MLDSQQSKLPCYLEVYDQLKETVYILSQSINDRYGHHAGDQTLRIAAGIVSSRLRVSDILVRWGGEEFLLVMPRTASDAARLLPETVSGPATGGGCCNPSDLSAGLASCRQRGNTMEQRVPSADQALYKARHASRNCVAG